MVVAGSGAFWRPGVTRRGPGCCGPAWGDSVAGLAGVELRQSTQSKVASEALLVTSFLRVCVICVTPALVSMPLNVWTRAWRNVPSVETTRRPRRPGLVPRRAKPACRLHPHTVGLGTQAARSAGLSPPGT